MGTPSDGVLTLVARPKKLRGMGEGRAADAEGQIPFRIRIGVTGHRRLRVTDQLTETVREQVSRIWDARLRLPEQISTPVRFAVVSALADGADRLVVREVLAEGERRGEEARLEVILPMQRDAYVLDQEFSDSSLAEFDELLDAATLVTELPEARAQHRYKHAGQAVVNRCDLLLALWDGGTTGGEGGSAETLLYAAARWRPCIWISTEDEHPVSDNFEPGSARAFLDRLRPLAGIPQERAALGEPVGKEPRSVLDSVADTFGWLRQFNEQPLPRDFSVRKDREFRAPFGDPAWIVTPYLRADQASGRNQKLFVWATRLMAGLATLAAAALAANVSFYEEQIAAWAWVELGTLVALLGVFVVSHSGLRLHKRWLSYRLLAERLRSARFLAATGVSFPRVAGLRDVFVERQSADWVERAFEEIWDSRPGAGLAQRVPKEAVESLKRWLAGDWIEHQIQYHRRKAGEHERRERQYSVFVTLLFAFTLLAVLLHALHLREDVMTFLSIVLPVAAAAVGVILTVRQHRALAERFRRMETELADVKTDVLEADEETLQRAGTDAARVIAEENGDWFGAMWFLDIEHPP